MAERVELNRRSKTERVKRKRRRKKTKSKKEVKPETRKLTINLPENLFKKLQKKSFNRKDADEKNASMTAIVIEALSAHLK